MNPDDYLYGCDILGAVPGTPIFTDSDDIRNVQAAITRLPQYKVDKRLDLGNTGQNHDGVDGEWGPKTAAAVERINAYYREGGNPNNDGPYITQGTLDALRLAPVAAPSSVVPGGSKPSGFLASLTSAMKGGASGAASAPSSTSPSSSSSSSSVPGVAIVPQPAGGGGGGSSWPLYVAGGLGAVGVGVIVYGLVRGSRG